MLSMCGVLGLTLRTKKHKIKSNAFTLIIEVSVSLKSCTSGNCLTCLTLVLPWPPFPTELLRSNLKPGVSGTMPVNLHIPGSHFI